MEGLRLAWKRVKDDIVEGRVFIIEPYEIELIEQDLENWLKTIYDRLKNKNFNPSSAEIIDCPKIDYGIRPGSHLTLTDRVIYAGLVGSFYDKLIEKLEWSRSLDYAHRLTGSNKTLWVQDPFFGWDMFREQSIEYLDQGKTYVVFCDISAFYENVVIEILISDLKALGIEEKKLILLQKCLAKWNMPVSSEGLPQGHHSSDILSKVYLDSVDETLVGLGYKYVRYSDDFRIFCDFLTEAKKAIVDLNRTLRIKGLNLNSAKTKIERADIARKRIDGIVPTIKNITSELAAEIFSINGLGNPYMTIAQIRKLINANPKKIDIEAVRKAYKTYFIDDTNPKHFEKSLFHYLLNSLSKANDSYAVESCLGILILHPEETKDILEYFNSVSEKKILSKRLAYILKESDQIYDYQIYLVLNWFDKNYKEIDSSVTFLARDLSFDGNKHFYIKSVARKILSELGNLSDIDRLRQTYGSMSTDLERAQTICFSKRMEKGKRNYFFSQVKDDGFLENVAVKYIRQRF